MPHTELLNSDHADAILAAHRPSKQINILPLCFVPRVILAVESGSKLWVFRLRLTIWNGAGRGVSDLAHPEATDWRALDPTDAFGPYYRIIAPNNFVCGLCVCKKQNKFARHFKI